MDALTIVYIILLLCASALCIALIIYLNRITKAVKSIESDIKEYSSEIKPLLESTTNLSEKFNLLTAQANEQADVVKKIIGNVKDHVDQILTLEEKLRKGIEEPATDIIKNLSAVVNGVNTFWKTYKNKHQT